MEASTLCLSRYDKSASAAHLRDAPLVLIQLNLESDSDLLQAEPKDANARRTVGGSPLHQCHAKETLGHHRRIRRIATLLVSLAPEAITCTNVG